MSVGGCDLAGRAGRGPRTGEGCPSPGLGQDREFLQRGCRRLSRCLVKCKKQELGDDMQSRDDVTQGRRILRNQSPRGPGLQFG